VLASKALNSEETRLRLVTSGLMLFGSAGRDGVSTRDLSQAAGTTLNAITYHFGGKDGMYLAVAEHIVETTGARLRNAADAGLAGLDDVGSAVATARVGMLLAAVVRTVLEAPDAAARGGFILREQLQPTVAFDVLHAGFVAHLHVALTRLTARATGGDAGDPAMIILAHGLLGQALIFGMARQTLARCLGKEALGPDDLAPILTGVEALATAALAGLKLGDAQ